MESSPSLTPATPVDSKDSVDDSIQYNNDDEETEEIPERIDICSSIGDFTAQLSQVSLQKEKEPEKAPSRGRIATFIRRVRPMIHGKFMAFLAISNLIFVLFIVLALLAFIVMGGFTLHSYLQYKALVGKQHQNQCAVIYGPWNECSGKCTNWDKQPPEYPSRTRKVIDIYGSCSKKLENQLKKKEDKIDCNLYNCLPSNVDAQN